MATVPITTYGYMGDATAPLATAKECQVALTANNQEQITLLNENGIANGTITAKISSKHTVPVGQVEQKRLLDAFFNQTDTSFTYATGKWQVVVDGKISSCTANTAVQQGNSFDVEFTGFVRKSQFDS